jgi:integrase/recombinase XerD
MPAIQGWELFLYDQGRSPYTIKAFVGDMKLFADFIPTDRGVGTISTDEINRFLKWLQEGRGIPCSPKSLARRITSIKSFFRWLHRYSAALVDPAEKVLQKSVISPLPTVLTTEEEQMILDTANRYRTSTKPDTRPYTLVALLLTTGIKKGECLALHQNHIDLQSPTGPNLFVRYANPSNRYKERKIALNSDWTDSYIEYIAQYQPAEEVFPWSPRRLEYILEDISKDAGLVKHLSFDMCRWTCALNDWRTGDDHEKIRQKLGISKIQWREISRKLQQLAGDTKAQSEPDP